MVKLLTAAEDRVGDLKRRLKKRFMADGHVDAEEADLLLLTDEVAADRRILVSRIRFCQRGLGGGHFHRSLKAEARSLLRLAEELEGLDEHEKGSGKRTLLEAVS